MTALLQRFLLLLCFWGTPAYLFSQAPPANDECTGARFIDIAPSGGNYCSQEGEFSNRNATIAARNTTRPDCYTTDNRDVWFSFTAMATDVRITIESNNAAAFNPQVSLYYATTTDCNFAQSQSCGSDNARNGIAQLYKGGLFINRRYLIRIQGNSANQQGDFKICINNYSPPAALSSDCPTAAVLCDKSSFAIPFITGAGNDRTEINDARCFIDDGCAATNPESNSAWFKWTCDQTGTLEFNLRPLDSDDDLDFVVYELPNGANNCSGKIPIRCMAAGASPGGTPAQNQRCEGETGLRAAASDNSEPCGCRGSFPHDNFLSPIQMQSGKSYALVVNNFSNSQAGFSISWGGTGTFVGPKTAIITPANDQYCIGSEIDLRDGSTFPNGNIVSRHWSFDDGALPQDTANGVGPHKIHYNTPGLRNVSLTITTQTGCVQTVTEVFDIKAFQYDTTLLNPSCTNGTNGEITLNVSCGVAPYEYNFENSGFQSSNRFRNLSSGTYQIFVRDANRAYTDSLQLTLKDTVITLLSSDLPYTNPSCANSADGTVSPLPSGGSSPYTFNYNDNRGFVSDTIKTNLRAGDYKVLIRDVNQCKGEFDFTLYDPPVIDIQTFAFKPRCHGFRDGYALAFPSGGNGFFSYQWTTGSQEYRATNLDTGNYIVKVTDFKGCFAFDTARIDYPPRITANIVETRNPICYGDSTGYISLSAQGGTPPFRYSADGIRFQADSVFNRLPSGEFRLIARDSSGCIITLDTSIAEPTRLMVGIEDTKGLKIDLGFSELLRAVAVPTSRPVIYKWTPPTNIDCDTCENVTVTPLKTTEYRVLVTDTLGCKATAAVLVQVSPKHPVFIPNAFSPNADGVNDRFTVYSNQAGVQIKEIRIFNRWGGLMYEGKNIPIGDEEIGWNGTINGENAPSAVYAVYAIVRFIDGEEIVFKGDFTLLR